MLKALENLRKNFIAIIVAMIVLISNPVWFLWYVRFFIVIPLALLLFAILMQRLPYNRYYKEIFGKKFLFFTIFFAYFVVISSFVGGSQSYLFISALILLSYFLLTPNEKETSLKIITKVLGLIVFFSFVPWLINSFVFKLPVYDYISYY